MSWLSVSIAARWRALSVQSDRGEFGPMAYAVMVSAMVLLAIAVAAWGEGIANTLMGDVDAELPGGGE